MHRAFLLLALALVLNGCFLTDSGERGEVSTRDINFPASGYEQLDEEDYPRINFGRTAHDLSLIHISEPTRPY